MTIYIEAQKKLLEDRELFEFLLDSNLYLDYLETIALVSQLYEEYEHGNLDYLLKNLPRLDSVRYFIIKFLTEYLSYMEQDVTKIEDVVSAVNNFIALIRKDIDSIFSEMPKSKVEAIRLFRKRLIMLIGELLEFYKICLLKSPNEAVKYILIKRRFVKELVARATSKSEKLKELEREFEVAEIKAPEVPEMPKEEEKPMVMPEEEIKEEAEKPEVLPEKEKSKKEEPIEVPKKLAEELEKEVERKEIELETKKEGIFTEDEIHLLSTLISLGATGIYIPKDMVLARSKFTTKQQIDKIAKAINKKSDSIFKVPIIYIGDEFIGIVPRFDEILNEFEKYYPTLASLYRMKREEVKMERKRRIKKPEK